MITQEEFDSIQAFSQKAGLTSLGYTDYEDIERAEPIKNTNELKIIYKTDLVQPVIEYAAENMEVLLDFLNESQLKGALHFVPEAAVLPLCGQGFKVLGEYADYICKPITLAGGGDGLDGLGGVDGVDGVGSLGEVDSELEFAKPEDAAELSGISQSCLGQSRGFFGETLEWFTDWIQENKIIIKRSEGGGTGAGEGAGEILGFCCLSIYNEGTTLWIRELSVAPRHQRMGVGAKLLEGALVYGLNEGAVKGFLAVDVENTGAIGLYERFGFRRKGQETEIHMIRE